MRCIRCHGLTLALAAALLAAGCGSGCDRAPAGADGEVDAAVPLDVGPDVQPDVQVADADVTVQRDAAPPWDSGPPIDAVAGSVIQLPPTGLNVVAGPWHHNHQVVYSEGPYANQDVYLFDLTTRQSSLIGDAPQQQAPVYIWENTIMWSDARDYNPPTSGQREVYSYDIPTQSEQQVTDSGYLTSLIRINSEYLLYATNEDVPISGGSNLVLRHRVTGDTQALATYDSWWEGADMSETHVSWVAHAPGEGGSYKSVYLHEIATGLTSLIQSTVPGRQFQTSTWGDWVVWQDDRNGAWDVYAYQISAGLESRLADEPHDQTAPMVREDLVVWVDYRWSGQTNEYNGTCDLVIYDLQTGLWRRVTGWTDSWGFGRAQGGWLLYRKQSADPYMAQIFAMDLQANLLLDSAGRVLPWP
jgi:beta propeller repeat protein